MIINLYQSRKLNGHLDPHFYQECRITENLDKDPLYNWYADIAFVNRKKYLIIANSLTKFTFFIVDYSRKNSSWFGEDFCESLAGAQSIFEINPLPFVDSIEGFAINEQSNKSISAHISRIKEEFIPSIKSDHYKFRLEDSQAILNKILNERPTAYNKSTKYEYPYEVMKKVLAERNLN